MSVPIEWLESINKELRDAGVEQRKRPWEAIRTYALEFRVPISISSSAAKEIIE